MKTFQINSFDAVNDFLFGLYSKSDFAFDPAEDIKTLTDKSGNPLFSEKEAVYFNKVLLECFIFCIHNDLNIYTIAAMVQYDFYQNKTAA